MRWSVGRRCLEKIFAECNMDPLLPMLESEPRLIQIHFFLGIVSDCPGRMRVPEIPLALLMADTDEPVRPAMVESESPDLTTYLTVFGLGFGLALTMGFGFGLVWAVEDVLPVALGFVLISVVEMTGAGLEVPPGTIGTALDGGCSLLAISGSSSVFRSCGEAVPGVFFHLEGLSAQSST